MKHLELSKLQKLNQRIGEEVVVEFADLKDNTTNYVLGEFDCKITKEEVILIDNENGENTLYININKIVDIIEHDDYLEVIVVKIGIYNIY